MKNNHVLPFEKLIQCVNRLWLYDKLPHEAPLVVYENVEIGHYGFSCKGRDRSLVDNAIIRLSCKSYGSVGMTHVQLTKDVLRNEQKPVALALASYYQIKICIGKG